MRPVLVIPGVCLALLGAVWTLQGANVIMGSVMSGSTFWLGAGVAVWIVGIILLVAGFVRAKPRAAPGTA